MKKMTNQEMMNLNGGGGGCAASAVMFGLSAGVAYLTAGGLAGWAVVEFGVMVTACAAEAVR